MSEDQLKAFMEAVNSDSSLQDKLKEASDVDAVVGIAKGAGFAISAYDLKSAQGELSNKELETVAGGICAGFLSAARNTMRCPGWH
jgi:predicted ribosomally synthesized peptide with nif11-like leader